MSSRWRGLAHGYLRSSLQSFTPQATQLPTPPASPYLSAMNNPRSLLFKRERELLDLNVKGIRGILTLVGVDGSSATKVEEEFGDSAKRIQEQAMNIARIVKEGVMSGWFELVRVPGVVVPPGPEGSPLKHRRSSSGGKLSRVKATKYDDEAMENVFKGFGREEGGVMCTVEFGLVCVRKGKEEAPDSANPQSEEDSKRKPEGGCSPGAAAQVLERRMLMKPKVLLESVEEML
jgi:hypothetical protein